jgi:hypothetical protein
MRLPVPSAPLAPSFSGVGETGVTVNWPAVSGAASYDVWRSQGTDCSGVVKITTTPVTGTSYLDSGLGCGAPYSYFVTANNTCGASVSGACNTATTSGCSIPPPETAPGGTLGTSQSWLGLNTHQWPANAQATSYNLYRGVLADLPSLLTGAIDSCTKWTGSGTNCAVFDDPTGVAGGFYWYLVTGVNAIGEGNAGNASTSARIVNSSGLCP